MQGGALGEVRAEMYSKCILYKHYCIAGYFRGANISRLVVLVHFAEINFVDHCNGIQPQAT